MSQVYLPQLNALSETKCSVNCEVVSTSGSAVTRNAAENGRDCECGIAGRGGPDEGIKSGDWENCELWERQRRLRYKRDSEGKIESVRFMPQEKQMRLNATTPARREWLL